MQRAAFGHMQLENVITADFNDEATRAEQDVRSFEGNFGAKGPCLHLGHILYRPNQSA
jgi:hypothetical protein